ncbi:hypothetical protein GCM10011309_02190 [Litorimonas cladophorae]|uniref:TIGR04255 family protein n=1 Tax=Litorimonas cladophorae TaxID=1220491 RepID=A0A918NC21_9PROT|nr:TIGR04255 family protein [Litorimonas cladophorae]GGX56878.1 hypothetical protein GCM10011309_02190 [Litorimonas cladophorae]
MLKEYSNAPIKEVTMALHFDPISKLNVVKLVSNCLELKEAYGGFSLEEVPFVEVSAETEARKNSVQHFKIAHGVPELACRLISEDRTISVVVQNNRFSATWVRQNDGGYPRYDELKPAFFDKFNQFRKIVERTGGLIPKITQCGIQYVNHILDDNLDGFKSFNFLDISEFQDHEGVKFSTSQRLTNEEEVGRLYMEAQTVFSLAPDVAGNIRESRNLKLSLTFRGKPKLSGIDGCAPFLDRGHHAIVSTFSKSLSDLGRKQFGESQRG